MSQNDTPNDGVSRRTALKGLTIGGAGVFAFSGVGAATPGKGNASGSERCDIVIPDDSSTIQAAIDTATPGDSICVKDGTYAEQLLINKSLTIRSAEGADPTLVPPASPATFTIPESGPTWAPMVFAYGGTEQNGSVNGPGTIDVSLTGLTLDGQGTQPDARRKPAVLYRNASGTVSENSIKRMGVGGKETFGILAYGDSEVTISDNTVHGYERGGIGANGDGVHPAPSVSIRNNTISGSTGIGEAWGPNGIQVGFGATGDVRNNDVADHRYSETGPVAAGILLFESDGVTVQDNHVQNADIALSCGSWGWFRQSADNNKFLKNHVVDASYGVLIESVTEPYGGVLTQIDPSASNNKIIKNHIEDDETTGNPAGQIGVGVLVKDHIENEYVPVAENNKLIHNTISGFETKIEDEGSNTKVQPYDP